MSNLVQNEERKQETTPARTGARYLTPDVNIYETAEAYFVVADLPGVDKAGLEVSLDGNQLVIVGHRSRTLPDTGVLHRESRSVDFRRAFELDPSIKGSDVAARMEQGVLTVELPKTEEVKPRRIKIA